MSMCRKINILKENQLKCKNNGMDAVVGFWILTRMNFDALVLAVTECIENYNVKYLY